MSYLILVRHGQSKWNALGLWQGQTDIELTEQGEKEATRAAEALKHIPIHTAHTSRLKRAQKTLQIIKDALQLSHIPTTEHEALNERHYGVYQGKNKWEVKKQVGDEAFHKIRRSWDHPIPQGETFKDVYERVIPYFETAVLKDIKQGKNVIVTAHHNSLRPLVKYLEHIPNDKVADIEIGTGEIYLYELTDGGEVVKKEILASNPNTGKI